MRRHCHHYEHCRADDAPLSIPGRLKLTARHPATPAPRPPRLLAERVPAKRERHPLLDQPAAKVLLAQIADGDDALVAIDCLDRTVARRSCPTRKPTAGRIGMACSRHDTAANFPARQCRNRSRCPRISMVSPSITLARRQCRQRGRVAAPIAPTHAARTRSTSAAALIISLFCPS